MCVCVCVVEGASMCVCVCVCVCVSTYVTRYNILRKQFHVILKKKQLLTEIEW